MRKASEKDAAQILCNWENSLANMENSLTNNRKTSINICVGNLEE